MTTPLPHREGLGGGSALHFTQHRSRRKLAVGMEDSDEATCDEVEHITFHVAQRRGNLSCGNDGVVVGHFRGVEHTFGLAQGFSADETDEVGIGCHTIELRLIKSIECRRTFRIDVIGEILRIYARISGKFLLVQRLNEIEGLFSTITKLTVTIYLQRSEVVELWRLFLTFFFLHLRHCERFSFDGGKGSLTFFFLEELTLRGCKGRIAIDGREYPVWLWLEVLDFLLTTHDKCERGCLHTSYGKNLTLLSIFHRIETRTVDAQQPVADGTAKTGNVQFLVLCLVFQVLEAFTDGFVSHRRNPKTLHGARGTSFLHHPTLNEFTLLSGITAIDDTVGSQHQFLNDGKLLLDALVILHLDAKTWRNHRQILQPPLLPFGSIFTRLLQFAQVSEGPSDLVAIAFNIALMLGVRPDDARDVACHARLFCYTNNHFLCCIC